MTFVGSWSNLGIDKAFFINLDKREDRRSQIVAQMTAIGLEPVRHSAQDASNPFPVFSDYPILNTAPQLACLYSHLSLWRELIAYHRDNVFLVIEDDCCLAPRLPSSLTLTSLPAQWEILQLGTNFPAGLARNLRFHQLGLVALRWEPPGWGSFAYLAKRSCMQRLVEQYLPSGQTLNLIGYHWPERVAADALLYHDANSYTMCFPLATTVKISAASDIGYDSKVMAMTEQARQMVEKLWLDQGIIAA